MVAIDNAYKIPHLHVTGHLCRTNIRSSTGMRAFGGPQSILTMETVVADVAMLLNVEPDKVSIILRHSYSQMECCVVQQKPIIIKIKVTMYLLYQC